MARNLDPKCRQCRREGEKLFLKGEKCFSDKCAIERRSYLRILKCGFRDGDNAPMVYVELLDQLEVTEALRRRKRRLEAP